jgi:hypothetical protein
LNVDLFSNQLTALRSAMGRISRFAFTTAPHLRLAGACVLAGLIGVGIAFLAAVLTGRTSISEAGLAHADTRIDRAAVPARVTFDRRRNRLDLLAQSTAKADFLAELVDPLDRSQRRLKATPVTAVVVDDVARRVASIVPQEARIDNVADATGSGPVSLIGPAFDAALSDGTQRALSSRPDRQSREIGRTAAGAGGSISGAAGRAAGGLGL